MGSLEANVTTTGKKLNAEQFRIGQNAGQNARHLASVKDQKIQDREGVSWDQNNDRPAQATITDEFVASLRTQVETPAAMTPVNRPLSAAASRFLSRGQAAETAAYGIAEKRSGYNFKMFESSAFYAMASMSGATPQDIARAKSEARTTAISTVRNSMDQAIMAGEQQRIFT